MTREEAIKQLSDAEHCLAGHGDLWDVDMEAFDMAIKALKQDSILGKIKADIAMYEADCRLSGDEEPCKQCTDNVFGSIYRIIDKYKAGE
jgi:hypothetical protein